MGELYGRPVLKGKVSLSDELTPDEPIAVEPICQGTVRSSAAADSKGRFTLDAAPPGNKDQAAGAITTSGSLTQKSLEGCQLRAVLPGYRSDAIELSKYSTAHNPDVGAIVLRRLANVEGTTISATTAEAPKDARKAYTKGRDALREKKLDTAQQELQKAVQLYPKYAAAWFELGRSYENRGNSAEARRAYGEAVAADPKFVSPCERLMILAGMEGKTAEAEQLSARLIKLDPEGFPIAYLSNAIANYNLGNLDASEKSAAELIKLDVEHRFPKGERILGIVLAEKHKWEESSAHLRRFLAGVSYGDRAASPEEHDTKGDTARPCVYTEFRIDNTPAPQAMIIIDKQPSVDVYT